MMNFFKTKKTTIYRQLVILCLLSSLFLTGCFQKNNSANTAEESPVAGYYLKGAAATYTLTPTDFNASTHKVSYPQMEGLRDIEIQNNINQSLASEATAMITGASTEDTPVEVTYEVMRMDANILSVVFTGKQVIDGQALYLKSCMTFDLATANVIQLSNLLKDTDQARSHLQELFTAQLKDQPLKTQTINLTMGMYLDKSNLVLFFLDEPLSEEFTFISIPLLNLVDDLNLDFGENAIN